jgi:tetratricopeptide (TPR) repeat protein
VGALPSPALPYGAAVAPRVGWPDRPEPRVARPTPVRSAGLADLDRLLGQLPADAARAFRVLRLYPGPSADAGSVAALAGISRSAAWAALARLARTHLVEAVGDGRFGMSDRLRAYAAEQPVPDAPACRERLLRHLVSTASAAAAVAFPCGPVVALPPFGSAQAARAWLDAERATLLAVPEPAFALRLVPVLADYLDAGGYHADLVQLYRRALAAGGGAAVRVRLGATLCRLGQCIEALGHYRAALSGDDPAVDAEAMLRAGRCHERQGHGIQALAWHTEAYGLCTRIGDRAGQAAALRGMGVAFGRLGRLAEARDLLDRASAVAELAEAIGVPGLSLV